VSIRLKRVYDEPGMDDGRRILVDRIWPRGVSKQRAAFDDWMRDIAPSSGLRKWFGHRSDRWDEFREAYIKELDQHPERVAVLRELARKETVTLLFAAKNETHNNAVVLREYLTRKS
jgi:uncharacterized protein YeaO (DUF488 family)